MNKRQFISALKLKLQGLPQNEVEDRLSFYQEMIEDHVEEGVSEEEAVQSIGSVEEISTQILADIPFLKIVKEKIKPRRKFKTWEIILIALSSPIWISLLAALFSVVISLYASLWSAVISFWSVTISLAASSLGGVLGCLLLICKGNVLGGVILLCGAFVCFGLTILSFYACKWLTKESVCVCKKMLVLIKKCLKRKEN